MDNTAGNIESIEVSRRKALTTVAKLGLGSAGMVAALKAGALEDAIAAGRNEDLPKKGYHFVFVNHVTTNAFFTPTQSGAADACKLLGCTYSWTVAEMVHAMQTAIAGRADGIAVAIIDPVAFGAPIASAFAKGIPVISYNADGTPKNTPQTNMRLAYIGQSLYTSGFLMGQRIVKLVGSGGVVIFIATFGTANIQPRLDGAKAAIQQYGGGKINVAAVATGALEAKAPRCRVLLARPQEPQGHVRGGPGQHLGCHSDLAQVRPAQEGPLHRWLRPDARYRRGHQRRRGG